MKTTGSSSYAALERGICRCSIRREGGTLLAAMREKAGRCAQQVLLQMGMYNVCRQHYRVVDHSGQPLDEVKVHCRIGTEPWRPCGTTGKPRVLEGMHNKPVNFSADGGLIYRMGERIEWRFRRSGYADKVVPYYASQQASAEPFVVRMYTLREQQQLAERMRKG